MKDIIQGYQKDEILNVKEDQPIEKKDFMSINKPGMLFRKKKKGVDAGDVKDKSGKHGKFTRNEFTERRSLMDHHSEDSGISKSKFLGLFKLFVITSFIYALNSFCYTHRGGRNWDDLKVLDVHPE